MHNSTLVFYKFLVLSTALLRWPPEAGQWSAAEWGTGVSWLQKLGEHGVLACW